MQYISTRGEGQSLSFDDVLLAGLARDGGLYVPKEIPSLSKDEITALKGKPFVEIVTEVMFRFTGDVLAKDELYQIVEKAYSRFDHPAVAPLRQMKDNHWLLELYHGPTFSFKDYALQVVGGLFDYVLKKRNEKILIVGATSGDTGSAGIEAVRGSEHASIVITFPDGRVSDIQRKQMVTIDEDNVMNLSIEGTFDDCQDMVKTLFNDLEFRDHYNLSAINSINWARILVQISYYVATSINLGAPENTLIFSVPTGNFGNILAAWYAQQMGLPIRHLICASNKNDILTRYFETGKMIADGVEPTLSPSMDIQISSNFERLAYYAMEQDATALKKAMETFRTTASVDFGKDAFEMITSNFTGYRLDDVGILRVIKEEYEASGFVVDPHTACALYASKQWLKEHPDFNGSLVTVSTAHPAKFGPAVEKAIGEEPVLPKGLLNVLNKPEKYQTVANDFGEIKQIIENWVNK
ncbi:MAG: threonine synthase [Alphaproteobacteria bacterium]